MSPVTEKVQRLVMHAFRGIPGEMAVDFGKGDSMVVYGDNGTGKSTIADALEWYFTGAMLAARTTARPRSKS
jgi:chromosome segregation ATPase